MKRVFIGFCVLFMFLSACRMNRQADAILYSPTKRIQASPTAVPEPTIVPDDGSGPNVIGLYVKDKEKGVRRLVEDTFVSVWQEQQDIECFEVFAAREAEISLGRYQSVWPMYWGVFPNAAAYKVGYSLELYFTDGIVQSCLIKGPADTKFFWDFVEIYLYDDVHQKEGVRYSHLTEEDMEEDTLCTSIKLTPGSEIHQVASMKLTAFTYGSESDFNQADGAFLGFNTTSILLERA